MTEALIPLALTTTNNWSHLWPTTCPHLDSQTLTAYMTPASSKIMTMSRVFWKTCLCYR